MSLNIFLFWLLALIAKFVLGVIDIRRGEMTFKRLIIVDARINYISFALTCFLYLAPFVSVYFKNLALRNFSP